MYPKRKKILALYNTHGNWVPKAHLSLARVHANPVNNSTRVRRRRKTEC